MNKNITARASILACAAFAAACSGGSAKDAQAPATNASKAPGAPANFKVSDAQRARLTFVTLAKTSFEPTIEVTGTVAFNGDRSTQVLSAISGPVTRLLVNPGANVHAGDALATVSSPDFADAVSTYRKAIESDRNAKRILKLDEQLFQNDALARNDLDQARADAASAAADLEAAVQGLAALGVGDSTITAIRDGKQTTPVQGVIRSPIAGVVVEKLINPGQLLQAGSTAAFTVADLTSVWVMANVYESDIGFVAEGQQADVITDAQVKPVSAKVDYVAAIVDPGTRATTVRVLSQNPQQVLKRDMFVRVRIHSSRARNGLLVPTASVLRDDNNLPFVFVSMADGSFARRAVTLGYRVGDKYEITQGLAAGEKVVADGALFIQFAESQ